MLSQLGHVMMGVADSIMVGHVGATSLAAVSLSNVAFNVLLLFGIGVSYAITPLVASANGEKDDAMIVNVVRHGLVINLITALLLLGVIYFSKELLYHIRQPEDVVDLAIPYLTIISASIIPVLIFQTFRQFTEGLTHTRVAMVVVIAANVVNIIVNYMLIYGHAGFPALGLNGAGWATLFSRTFMAAFIVIYVWRDKTFARFAGVFRIGDYSRKLFNKMLHIGIPAGMQFIFEVLAFDASAVMMGWLGTHALAAHQIALNLATISYMTTSGLAAAATIRVGYFFGQRDVRNLRGAAYTLLIMALTIMTLWGLLFTFGNQFLPEFYVSNADVIAIASPLLIIAALFQLSDGAQVVCVGALRGLQDVKVPSLFIFIAYWVIGLPLGYLLGFPLQLGAVGIWLGLLIGLTLTAIAMFVRFRYLSRKLLAEQA